MTLAQSSHVIPTPSTKSPGLTPSPQVVRHKLRASPFPFSPTVSKDLSSPRSAGNTGSKVAKAVYLFSNLADEAGASTSDRLETPATSSFYIETSPNSSPFVKCLPNSPRIEPSSSSNTSLTVEPVVDTLHRDPAEQQQHDGETLQVGISSPSPTTIHTKSARGAECYLPPLNTMEEALDVPASAFSDLTASPAAADCVEKAPFNPENGPAGNEKACLRVRDQETWAQADSQPGSPPAQNFANTTIAQTTFHQSSRTSMPNGDIQLPIPQRGFGKSEDQESRLSWEAHRALLDELELLDSPPHIHARFHHDEIEASDNRHQMLVANDDLAGDTPELRKPLLGDLGKTSRIPLNQDESGDTASHQDQRDLSLLSKEMVEQGVNQRSQTNPALSSNRLTWHSQDDLQDSSDGDRSVANGAMLFDLIDMVDTPASPIINARPRDSRLDRTAIWIKSTMNENGSIPELPASPHEGHVAATPLSLVSTSGTTARPAQLEHQRGFETLQQYVVEEEAASVDHMADMNDHFSTREPTLGSDGDPVAAGIRAIDSRRDPDRSLSLHMSPAQPNSERLGRSFSQRARTNQQAVEKVRRIPGRLKIPEAQSRSITRQSRDSLKLLESRRGQNRHDNEQAASSQLDTSRSRQVVESDRKNAATNMSRSQTSEDDQVSKQVDPSDRTRHHVGRMGKNWDGVDVPSDDEEVASVTTCKRMTLRRMSDFAVHATPRRASRPLPGKLSRLGPETYTTPSRLERPLMRLSSSQSSHNVQKSVRPDGRLRRPAESKLPPTPPSHGGYSTHRSGAVQQDISDGPNKWNFDILGTSFTLPPEGGARTTLGALSSDAHNDEARSASHPRKGSLTDTGTQQEAEAVIKRNPPTRTITSSKEGASFKPLKLQTLSSAFSTPRRLAVSTTETSPRTIVSELWTPAQSNPAGSALTDETRVSVPLPSRAAPDVGIRPGQRSAGDSRQGQGAIPPHREIFRDSSRYCARLNSREHHQASHDSTSHLQSRSHSTPDDHRFLDNQTQLGAHHDRRRPMDPFSSAEQSQRQQQHMADASRHVSDASVPGFEISFQLTEPQMAPNVQQGTLLEFGLRVHIKPSKPAPSGEAWTPRPPSLEYGDSSLGSSRREASLSHLPQFEYDNLSASDMSRVQEEAQEHLYRTITLPKQRTSRLNAGGVDPNSSFNSTAVSDTTRSTNSRTYLRAMRLTGSRQLSGSRSVESSNIVDRDQGSNASRPTAARRPSASPGLASPLPYIKRAPPRAASLSTVVLHS